MREFVYEDEMRESPVLADEPHWTDPSPVLRRHGIDIDEHGFRRPPV